jgi:anti-sigma factor RsiW
MTQPWLEQELNRQLSPVRAPDFLWERIHEQRRPLRAARSFKFQAMAAVIALAAIAVGLTGSRSPADLRALSERELRSANPRDTSGNSLSLIGARTIRWNGQPVAAITYKTGGQVATMLITGNRTGTQTKHGSPTVESTADTRFVSWTTGTASYMVAMAGPQTSLQAACVLCHAD